MLVIIWIVTYNGSERLKALASGNAIIVNMDITQRNHWGENVG